MHRRKQNADTMVLPPSGTAVSGTLRVDASFLRDCISLCYVFEPKDGFRRPESLKIVNLLWNLQLAEIPRPCRHKLDAPLSLSSQVFQAGRASAERGWKDESGNHWVVSGSTSYPTNHVSARSSIIILSPTTRWGQWVAAANVHNTEDPHGPTTHNIFLQHACCLACIRT
jgi:hypothetical protein